MVAPAAQLHRLVAGMFTLLLAVHALTQLDAACCRRALKALADLFALRCIEQDVIFRNDEFVAPAKVYAGRQLAWCMVGFRIGF